MTSYPFQKMYYVVQFTNDGDIAVVPRSWWTNDATAWPPYKGHRLTRAIKDCEQPSVDWVSYPCRVMASSCEFNDGDIHIISVEFLY